MNDEPLAQNQITRLTDCLTRIRATLDSRETALASFRTISGLPSEHPSRPTFLHFFEGLMGDFNAAVRVELNYASAVLDGDVALAESAGAVIAALDEKVGRGLTTMERLVAGMSE